MKPTASYHKITSIILLILSLLLSITLGVGKGNLGSLLNPPIANDPAIST
jgi:hypothetical protein